jgi:hypothetical protein
LSRTTSRLALYIAAFAVVVIALLVLIWALPPQPSGPKTDADTPATASVPIISEPAHKPPTPTPLPTLDPNALYIQ